MCVMPGAPHIASGVIRHTEATSSAWQRLLKLFGLHFMKSDISSAQEHFRYSKVEVINN